ncbi:hypothetical protein CR513_38850, partial [Mucuna pruriens]
MSINLKNVGVTYQRLMDKVFFDHIDWNLEVEFANPKQHIQDLEEIFAQVWKYNMQLNPEKCVCGEQDGKFLGFMLTHREI